jgi:hypothetical protein
MASSPFLSLPNDILILLPEYVNNIEDYMNLASTCKTLQACMYTASPNTILRLAAAQSSTFFRPSPHFLVTATARQLGHWARESQENEDELAARLEEGIDGLLDLVLEHCGLTIERIRELHLQKFSIINPVTDVIDKCVGAQWYGLPNFWNGGVDDAATIDAEPPTVFFLISLYGELFGPDFEAFLDPSSHTTRKLSMETRLEFLKYCAPDIPCHDCQNPRMPDGSPDFRRIVKDTGPYHKDAKKSYEQHIMALVWVLQSSRWRPHWRDARARAGVIDFQSDNGDDSWYDPDDTQDWRQRMLEAVMVCQGLEGLGMIRPDLQDDWFGRIRTWREEIARLEKEPEWINVGHRATLEYPYFLGDVRVLGNSYVGLG